MEFGPNYFKNSRNLIQYIYRIDESVWSMVYSARICKTRYIICKKVRAVMFKKKQNFIPIAPENLFISGLNSRMKGMKWSTEKFRTIVLLYPF